MNSLKGRLAPYLYVLIAAALVLALAIQAVGLGWATFQSWRVARIVRGWETSDTQEKPTGQEEKVHPPQQDPSNSKPPKNDQPDKYKAITERGVFVKPKPTPPPPLSGILGDQAIFGDQTVGVGAETGGWKVLEINERQVVVEKDGNKQTLDLFQELQMSNPQHPNAPESPPAEHPGKAEAKPGSKAEQPAARDRRRATTGESK